MKVWKRLIPIVLSALVVVAAVAEFTLPVVARNTSEEAAIPQRVYAGAVDIGGLKTEDAIKKIKKEVKKTSKKKLVLAAGKNTIEVSLEDLGLSWKNEEIVQEAVSLGKEGNLIRRYKAMKDLEKSEKVYPLAYSISEKKVSQVLEENLETFNTSAKDASLKRKDGAFVISSGKEGVALNVKESVKAIEDYFASLTPGELDSQAHEATIALVAEVTSPKGTEEELSKVKDVLGTYTTNFSGSAWGRVKNVENGSSLINGTVLYPGDAFSVYQAVAPFTAGNGYALAGSYENGTVVQTYGGGICQVSTTLYNAVIRAELDITERHPHSMLVAYVPASADAAIAGTSKDLKFKNTTDAPIYIRGTTKGRTLTFTIYGQKEDPNREIAFESQTTGTIAPKTVTKKTNAPEGSRKVIQTSNIGKTAKLWKIVKEDGVEVSREEFNSSRYMAKPTIVEVGTKKKKEDKGKKEDAKKDEGKKEESGKKADNGESGKSADSGKKSGSSEKKADGKKASSDKKTDGKKASSDKKTDTGKKGDGDKKTTSPKKDTKHKAD